MVTRLLDPIPPVTPAVAPNVAAPHAPVAVSSAMQSARDIQFRDKVAHQIHQAAAQNIAPDGVWAQLTTEQQALAAALGSEAVAQAFAETFRAEEAALVGTELGTISSANARTDVDSILRGRQHDAQYFAALLQDPAFRQQVMLRAASPESATPPPPLAMAEGKHAEMVETFVRPAKPDVAIHDHAEIVGHRLFHEALVKTYQSAALKEALSGAIAQYAPQAAPARVAQLAENFLADRIGPARDTVTVLAEDGPVTRDVMQQATALHIDRLNASKPVAHAARIAQSRSEQIDKLVMEV